MLSSSWFLFLYRHFDCIFDCSFVFISHRFRFSGSLFFFVSVEAE